MTLVSSGTLHIKGSSSSPTTSIQYEITGSTTAAYSLSDAIAAKTGTAATSITDFYGYTHATIPADPTKCNTTEAGGTVTATWFDASSDETGFRVEYQVNSGAWTFEANVGAGVTTRDILGYGCSIGDTVGIRVRAYNAAGDSGWCTDASPLTTTCL